MTIIQVSSFIDQKLGVLSTTQRIDYFWVLGQVRVKNVCFNVQYFVKDALIQLISMASSTGYL